MKTTVWPLNIEILCIVPSVSTYPTSMHHKKQSQIAGCIVLYQKVVLKIVDILCLKSVLIWRFRHCSVINKFFISMSVGFIKILKLSTSI